MLAYDCYNDSLTPAEGVAIMSLEGDAPEKHFPITDSTLRWTPDSAALLYYKADGGVDNLWIQAIARGPPKQLTHISSGHIKGFDVSRDGKQLVMDRNTWDQDVVLIRDVH